MSLTKFKLPSLRDQQEKQEGVEDPRFDSLGEKKTTSVKVKAKRTKKKKK